jgi:hypothetical protein
MVEVDTGNKQTKNKLCRKMTPLAKLKHFAQNYLA